MVSPDKSPAWDFTPVINLLHSLYSQDGRPLAEVLSSAMVDDESTSQAEVDDELQGRPQGLGNFDKVWRFLDLPLDVPPLKLDALQDKENRGDLIYSSSQFDVVTNAIKGVRWRDELAGGALEDNSESEQLLSPLLNKKGSKKSRAKKRTKSSVDNYYDDHGRMRYNWMQHVKPKAERETQKKGAKQRSRVANGHATTPDVTTDAESEDELRKLRHSPDRR